MIRINDLTATLKVASDEYKKRYDLILANKKGKEKELAKNYIACSDLYKKEAQNIKEKFAAEVEKLQKEIQGEVSECFRGLREHETKKVKNVDAIAIGKMNAIYDLPLTTSELSALNEQFGKNRDYWCEKILSQMCEKNGVKPAVLGLESDYETKMNILSELEGRLQKLFDDYNGESTVGTEMLLHESVLGKYELKYAGSYENLCLSSVDVAHSAYNSIVSKNQLHEKSVAIQNVLNNADELTRAELMLLVLDDPMRQDLIMHSNVKNKFEEFEEKGIAEYKEAKSIIEKAKKAEDNKKANEILAEYAGNKYVSMLAADERKINRNFAVVSED